MTARLVLLALLPITAGFALVQRRRLFAILGMALFSLLLASVFFLANAPDVAITEAAIGAALVTFVYVLAIRRTGRLNVVASEVPSLIERRESRIDGLEWEILERLARQMGLDLAVRFVPAEEVQDVLLEGEADIGAGGLVRDDIRADLLRTPGHLPTAHLCVVGPKGSPSVREPQSMRGYFSDLVDAIRQRAPVAARLDLARFLALSRYALDGYEITRQPESHEYTFAITPSRRDLHDRLVRLLDELRERGELEELIGRYVQ